MHEQVHHEFVQRLPYLRELDQHDLDPVLMAIEVETYSTGEIIAQQGTPAREILVIFEGAVELIHRDSAGELEHQIQAQEGMSIGVVELVEGKPWWGDIQAASQVTLLRWPRPAVSHFIQSHPEVLDALKRLAGMEDLLRHQKFAWLAENEAVCAISRRHKARLFQSLTLPITALALGLASWIWAPFGEGAASLWIGVGMTLAGIALGLWRWVDWGNDFCVVTNRRAVMLEKVIGIYDNRQETPLQWVLSVSVGTGALGRWLGFGDLIIRTYTGELIFEDIPNTFMFASILEDQWMRYKHRRNLTAKEDMLEAIRERIVSSEEFVLEPEVELGLIDRPIERIDKGESHVGLDRWTLKTRFEDGGVITYRKHWAILLRQVFTPSLLILLTITLTALSLSGFFEAFDRGISLLLGSSLTMLFVLWLVYRYIDWANDIYQITPNHIVDVKKKPLAREVRMVAPLENILGTEIDRTGFFSVILNFGSVVANVGTTQFSFDGVNDPARVQQDIVLAQDSFLERQAEAERLQRRDEVVEWLSAYHEETRLKDIDPPDGMKIHGDPRNPDES